MTRLMTFAAVAVAATSLTVYAQDTKTTVQSETKSSGGEVKTMTYTGCVHQGTEAKTYVLDKVVPLSRTTTSNDNGTISTTTTYMLVPGDRVDVQTHLGQKVEVTGMLIPEGKVETETKTKVEREDAKDTTTKEKSKTKNGEAQFRVTSIKTLAERCE